MNTKFTHLLIATSAALILTGCGGTTKRLYVGPANQEAYDTPMVKGADLRFSVGGAEKDGSSLTIGDMPVNAFWLALQGAAEDTIARGDNYFSIYRPRIVSNYDGANFTDAEQLKLVCVDGMKPQGIDRYVINNIFSDANTILCNVTSQGNGYFEYTTSKTVPKDIGAFKAEDVITYMKTNGFYISEYDRVSRQVKAELSSGVYVYNNWVDDKRSSDGSSEDE